MINASADRYFVSQRHGWLVPREVSQWLVESTGSPNIMHCRQAGDIVAQLKAGIAMRATVVRDGREQEVEARDLVPGDIVRGYRHLVVRLLTQMLSSSLKKETRFLRTQG